MPFPYEVSSDSMEVDYTGTPYHHGYEAVLTPTPITLPNPLLSLQIPIGVSYLHLGEEDTYGTWPSGGDHYSQNQYVPRAFPALDLPAGLLSRSLPMERRNMGTVLRKHDTEKCMGEYRFACAKADQAYAAWQFDPHASFDLRKERRDQYLVWAKARGRAWIAAYEPDVNVEARVAKQEGEGGYGRDEYEKEEEAGMGGFALAESERRGGATPSRSTRLSATNGRRRRRARRRRSSSSTTSSSSGTRGFPFWRRSSPTIENVD